jgi:hypothetical protein
MRRPAEFEAGLLFYKYINKRLKGWEICINKRNLQTIRSVFHTN